MARLVERTIKKPLSELLLFGDLAAGSTVLVRSRRTSWPLRCLERRLMEIARERFLDESRLLSPDAEPAQPHDRDAQRADGVVERRARCGQRRAGAALDEISAVMAGDGSHNQIWLRQIGQRSYVGSPNSSANRPFTVITRTMGNTV